MNTFWRSRQIAWTRKRVISSTWSAWSNAGSWRKEVTRLVLVLELEEMPRVACRFYNEGRCNRGSACNFYHDPAMAQAAPEVSLTSFDASWIDHSASVAVKFITSIGKALGYFLRGCKFHKLSLGFFSPRGKMHDGLCDSICLVSFFGKPGNPSQGQAHSPARWRQEPGLHNFNGLFWVNSGGKGLMFPLYYLTSLSEDLWHLNTCCSLRHGKCSLILQHLSFFQPCSMEWCCSCVSLHCLFRADISLNLAMNWSLLWIDVGVQIFCQRPLLTRGVLSLPAWIATRFSHRYVCWL